MVERRSIAELLTGLISADDLARLAGVEVSGIYDDSRQVTPEGLFVAVRGTADDGRRYVADAVRRGARVVIGEALAPSDAALTVSVDDARAVLGHLAARWHGLGDGCGGLQLIGITGTNGKSTTAYMLRAILQAAGRRTALFGTVEYDLVGRTIAADMTTPGPLQLAAYLREAADRGADTAVLEVSSHALDQRRADGLRFAAAAFTNLSGDHLDYHETVDAYAAAKARLFGLLEEGGVAVVNADDAQSARMVADWGGRVWRFGLQAAADWRAEILGSSVGGTRFRLVSPDGTHELENALVGEHNVYNALAAAGLAHAVGVGLDETARGLADLKQVPGRLQRVDCDHPAAVFVDYAHTDDALRNVLGVVKPLARGRLIVVFGCGGDRDRTKRPRMGRVAFEFGDHVVLTSDNPRTEQPEQIIADALAGLDETQRRDVHIEVDRARAIAAALAEAGTGDIVVIAGKGHENYQVIGRQRLHFDDVEVARQAAAELAGRRHEAEA